MLCGIHDAYAQTLVELEGRCECVDQIFQICCSKNTVEGKD